MATKKTGGTSDAGGAASGTPAGGAAKRASKSAAGKSTGKTGAGDGKARQTGAADTQAAAPAKRARAKADAGAAGGAKKSAGGGTARARKPDLRADLRQFASERSQGWDHSEWTGLLDRLREGGHDTSDPDAIGMSLERERLDLALERVEGVGPQKRKALVDRYSTLWSLRQASVDEIASTAKVSRDVADRIKSSI